MSDNLVSGNDDSQLDLDDGAKGLLDEMMADDSVGLEPGAPRHDAPPSQRPYSPVRDDVGRFAPKGEERPAGETDAAAPPAAPPATIKELQELIEAREARQAAERDRDALRARLAQFERRPDQGSNPDLMFSDPEGFQKALLQPVQAALAEQRFEFQQEMARREHGDGLKEAQKALVDTKNEALAQSLMRAPNPFIALMDWHRREKTLAAIPDGDLSKYEASLQEKLLKDPAFRTRVLEAARAEAGGVAVSASRLPANVTRLPSVARAGSAAVAALPDDLSDQELLEQITGTGR